MFQSAALSLIQPTEKAELAGLSSFPVEIARHLLRFCETRALFRFFIASRVALQEIISTDFMSLLLSDLDIQIPESVTRTAADSQSRLRAVGIILENIHRRKYSSRRIFRLGEGVMEKAGSFDVRTSVSNRFAIITSSVEISGVPRDPFGPVSIAQVRISFSPTGAEQLTCGVSSRHFAFQRVGTPPRPLCLRTSIGSTIGLFPFSARIDLSTPTCETSFALRF